MQRFAFRISKFENIPFYALIFFLPTQLGKHFWPDFSYVHGVRVDYLSPTIYFTDILVGTLFIWWLIGNLKQRFGKSSKLKTQKSKLQFKIQNSHPSILHIFILVFLLLNIFFSGRILGSMYSLLKFVEMAFVAYYSAKFMAQKGVSEKITMLLSVSVILQSLLAVAQYFKQGSLGGLMYLLGERSFDASTPGIANASLLGELVLRPYGTFPHPNVLASFLLVVMILVLFNIKKHKDKYKLVQLPALMLGTIALFLSMSRIACLLWIVVVVYYFYFHMKRKFLPLILVAVIAISLVTPLGARITGISAADESITQRAQLVESSVKMVKDSHLLGVGMGNFLPTLSQVQKPQMAGPFLQPVHNIYLLTAAEAGLVGLGLLVWLLWKTYRRIMNYELLTKETLLIMLTAILTLGLFDHYWLTLQQGQLLLAFTIGICWIGSEKKIRSQP